ncbi:MAG: DUF4175 domain-containing protein [Polyangiaceae bacterium]|nr:DUF4175 domain-containing protein [Polyangiaceae bacterium]
MKPSLLPGPLANLRDAWMAIVRPPQKRAEIALVCLAIMIALLVARTGTMAWRLLAFVLLLLSVATVFALRLREAHVFRDPVRTILRVAGRADREAADRAIRALSLLTPANVQGASAELGELHVRRTLAALPKDGVSREALRVSRIFAVAALFLATASAASCASRPWAAVEGFDVLISRGGVAPFGMAWLVEPEIIARPPDYLHEAERTVIPYDEMLLPRGTLITMRGRPVHVGRLLLLTDGDVEVPFVDDGSGHVVARWPLAESAKLRVIARFGDVIIPEPDVTNIESLADRPPTVILEGAPRRIVLGADKAAGSAEQADEIPIHYDVTDDHGLREVHLVLRAGPREERRVLASLDGEVKADRGGYTLRTTDPFIKKSHAPIEIRVEAKDNDPITGPKWGVSEAITVVPPDVGEPEARRLDALRAVRGALVDALAFRVSHAVPQGTKERRAFLDQEARVFDENSELLESTLTASHAGTRVSGRVAAMLRGKMRKLKEAVTNQARSPSTSAHAAVVKATERVVLVVDAVIQGTGLKDTHDVAKELAVAADDLALGATTAHKPEERSRGQERMDAAILVLGGGGRSMKRLGSLGRDLGEIVDMDLLRVSHAKEDFFHAALAAQDLAARLRQPDPSFGSRGGRPSHAGGESGGSRGSSGAQADGESSDVEQAFNEAAEELDKLAAEHAGQMGRVEQALAGAANEEDVKALREEAKKHAQKVRDAARALPSVGGGSNSWTSKGAAAREHAEQMARALEQGHASDAVESGRSAMSALEEAKRAAAADRWGRSDANPEKTVEDARKSLEGEVRWAEDKLSAMRKQAAGRAAPELRERGDDEGKLADRARDLSRRGRDSLPQASLEALEGAEQAAREAANALKQGDADNGLSRQREAQQKLDMARDALGDSDQNSGDVDSEGFSRAHADIPKADQHKGPEDFRKRVIKGLGQPSSGRLKDAVKRYAEGLLR